MWKFKQLNNMTKCIRRMRWNPANSCSTYGPILEKRNIRSSHFCHAKRRVFAGYRTNLRNVCSFDIRRCCSRVRAKEDCCFPQQSNWKNERCPSSIERKKEKTIAQQREESRWQCSVCCVRWGISQSLFVSFLFHRLSFCARSLFQTSSWIKKQDQLII